jgi:hypothetical protein
MGAGYTIVVRDVAGTVIGTIAEFISLDYARRVNQVGTLSLYLDPARYSKDMFPKDCRLEVWRGEDGALALDMQTCWFVRRRVVKTDTQGITSLMLQAVDANYLLGGRIVAYAAASFEANKGDYLDDMMKEVVRENLGPDATDTDREMEAYLSVATDTSGAPNDEKAFARKNVLTLLQDLASLSLNGGTYLAFDVEYNPNSAVPFTFRTYTGQRGADNRWPTGQRPVLLSLEAGNLADVTLEENWIDEATYIYAGGDGEGALRVIATASDADVIALSPFGRREAWVDARLASTSDELQAEADARLAELTATRAFYGRLVDCEGTLYGRHFGFGDYVTAQFENELFDVRIDAVHVTAEGNDDRVDARFESCPTRELIGGILASLEDLRYKIDRLEILE